MIIIPKVALFEKKKKHIERTNIFKRYKKYHLNRDITYTTRILVLGSILGLYIYTGTVALICLAASRLIKYSTTFKLDYKLYIYLLQQNWINYYNNIEHAIYLFNRIYKKQALKALFISSGMRDFIALL